MDFRITLLTLIISSCSPSKIEEDIFSDIEVAKPKIMGDFINSHRNKTYNTEHEIRILSNKPDMIFRTY